MRMFATLVGTCVKMPAVRNIYKVFGKVAEEMGEISVALHIPLKADEPLRTECCDLIIATMDLAWIDFLAEYDLDTASFQDLSDNERMELGVVFGSEMQANMLLKLNKWRTLNGMKPSLGF